MSNGDPVPPRAGLPSSVNLADLSQASLELQQSLEQQLIYARDLQRAFVELEQKELQRKSLMEKVISAQEDERRRIAIDIHDEVLQMLGFNLMKIDLIERLWQKTDYSQAFDQLHQLRDSLESAINLLRDLITEIRPPSLDYQGLLPTLDEYLKRFRSETGMEVALSSRLGRRQSPTLETLIYRLVQEALVNVRKHSGASRVAVEMETIGDSVHVVVADNGNGFQVEEALRASLARGSIGLASMIERIDLAGGVWNIESAPGQGTRVRFSVPVSA